jgi:hypothetical protein
MNALKNMALEFPRRVSESTTSASMEAKKLALQELQNEVPLDMDSRRYQGMVYFKRERKWKQRFAVLMTNKLYLFRVADVKYFNYRVQNLAPIFSNSQTW